MDIVLVSVFTTLACVFNIVCGVLAYLSWKYMQQVKKVADDMRGAFNANADAQEHLIAQVQDIQTRLSMVGKR